MEEVKIEIRCKTCGKLHMEITVDGRVGYNFKCKRCKRENIGYLTIMNMEDDNGKKQ